MDPKIIVQLAEIVNEADEVEPFLVRVLLADPLCSLEGVHNVGQVQVGITFINLSDFVCEIMFEFRLLASSLSMSSASMMVASMWLNFSHFSCFSITKAIVCRHLVRPRKVGTCFVCISV